MYIGLILEEFVNLDHGELISGDFPQFQWTNGNIKFTEFSHNGFLYFYNLMIGTN